MTRTALLSIALVAFAALAAPDPGSAQAVDGRLLDRPSGRPLAGAIVLLFDSSGMLQAQTRTGRDGAFQLEAPGDGAFRVQARPYGYLPAATPLLELAERVPFPLDLLVDPRPIEMEGFEVVAARVDADVARLGIRAVDLGERLITRDEIAGIPGARDVGGIITWRGPPGMRVVRPENLYPPNPEFEFCVTSVRGRRADGTIQCAPIFVDGVEVRGGTAALLRPDDIDAVVVLSGAEAATLYGTGTSPGVVLIYTRRGRPPG